ncbi:hypothetical protein ACFL4O_01240, partial [bacterium]
LKDVEKIEYLSKSDEVEFDAFGKTIEIFDAQDKVIIYDNVKLVKKEQDYQIESNHAMYKKSDGYIIFTENPVVTQVDETSACVYKGEKILYYPDTKKTSIEGSVQVECTKLKQ